jgi:CheY-like chemotaxis protein
VPDELNRRSALLVEDETLVAMIAEDYLADLGFAPRWVQTAAEALEVIQEKPQPALAVIDVGLPDMRGDELARRLLETIPDLPVILATGYDPGDLNQNFAEVPSVGTLGKPYAEADLRAAIAALGVEVD